MRKRVVYIVVLLLLGWTAGCDSNNDNGDNGLSDAEVFIGTWVLTNLLLNNTDVTGLVLAQANVEMLFANPGLFTLSVTDADGITTEVSGTYQLDARQLTLTLTSSDFDAPLAFNYVIQTDDRIRLDSDQPQVLSELSGIDPADLGIQVENVGLIIQRNS